MKHYTCKQLGVCQARIGCSECAKADYAFAPGTIEAARPRRRTWVVRAALSVLGCALLVTALVVMVRGWL